MNRLYILLAVLFANIALLSLVSCSDDDNGGGQPVIERVRTTDPALSDSTFTDAMVGQMILIEGSNLHNAVHVYINDQDVYFNSNYNTSTHLIVTIPQDLVVRGVDESLPLEIRIETTHGTATYAFHVIAGYPTLELYKAQLTTNDQGVAEMVPGQEVTLIGTTLHEVEHIYVTDLDTVPMFEITDFSVNADRTEIKLTMPSNEIPAKGIYMVECYAGNAYCGFSRSPQKPVLTDISTDMPIPGQKVVIYGKYLTDITVINLGGEIDIDVNTVETNENMDQLVFTMPDRIPSAESNGLITVATLGGRENLQFYDYTRVYEDFDGHGTQMAYGWGTNHFCSYPVWGWTAVPETSPIKKSAGYYVYFEGFTCWWDHNLTINSKAAPSGISASTPLSDIELRYEVYMHEQFTVAGNMTSTITVFGKEKGGIAIADRVSGVLMPGEWMSVAIPMTEIAPGIATYGDLCASDTGGDNFKIFLGYDNTGDNVIIAYDNFRFYVK